MDFACGELVELTWRGLAAGPGQKGGTFEVRIMKYEVRI